MGRFFSNRPPSCAWARRISLGAMRAAGVLLALVAAGPSLAQVRVDEQQWRRGYDGFTALCRAFRLETMDAANAPAWRALPPSQTVLVVFGHVDRLPSAVGDVNTYLHRGGAVLAATDRGDGAHLLLPGLNFGRGPVRAARHEDALEGFLDCPQVTSFAPDHPLTRGLRTVSTNRPGMLAIVGLAEESPWSVLARLPRSPGRFGARMPLMAARETPAGGRAVAVADQTIFANQMVFYDDNAQLTVNILRWLTEGERTAVLILDDRSIIAPPTPDLVEVDVPPPTPEEVRAALRNLPPETLLDFGNAVAAAVEDEGLPNDLIAYLMGRIPERDYQRLLIIAATSLLGLLAAWAFFSKGTSHGATLDPNEEVQSRQARRDRAARERQHAAREILERFRAQVARTSTVPWKVFAARVESPGQLWRTHRMRRDLRRAARLVEPGKHRAWTRRRLRRLEANLNDWRRLWESGKLTYRDAAPQTEDVGSASSGLPGP